MMNYFLSDNYHRVHKIYMTLDFIAFLSHVHQSETVRENRISSFEYYRYPFCMKFHKKSSKYESNRNYLLVPYFHFDELFENLLKFKFFVLYVCMINIVSDKLVETPKINLLGFSETELRLLKFPFWEFNLTNFSVGR